MLVAGQDASKVQAIDSFINIIENDSTIVKKHFDSVWYQQEDGGSKWDSAYYSRLVFYRGGKIVQIRAWTSYGNQRTDMLAFYRDDKAIRFSKGESFKGHTGYGKLDFQIYYYQDKDILVRWLTPKPDNVLGVGTDIFLQWAYSLKKIND